MDFEWTQLVDMVWTTVGTFVLGLIMGPVRKWYGTKSDNEWLGRAKKIIADAVQAGHQAIKTGMADAQAKEQAVGRSVRALTNQKTAKQISRITGLPVRDFVEMEVEAEVARSKQTAIRKGV